MATKDFAVFDNDSHVVEPLALWEKYLDPEYRAAGWLCRLLASLTTS